MEEQKGVCRNFSSGHCRFGDRCRFQHISQADGGQASGPRPYQNRGFSGFQQRPGMNSGFKGRGGFRYRGPQGGFPSSMPQKDIYRPRVFKDKSNMPKFCKLFQKGKCNLLGCQ